MEGDRKNGKRINIFKSEVHTHVVEESFFIPNEKVILKMIMNFEFGRILNNFNIFIVKQT
jgi:hypothetical protein